ncbi:phosphate ABC transporter substrate-binding protein PstS [Methylophaga pinxianii]|uniref:phosphate ABC transporter substrate-binding protein PstS n=1 Tax=Methylophaga pinxianii TaxID=2881052 RepID=UPI001CF42DA1|nr:phosphate ABC transporter substrate-binding protein PstS [Methylophaga pinxianii]MCB2427694.1 phosphate ABC transporter substrate-binding protein PstS [Methylophaga pinxianii]UPH46197.1 phosphate ABC transporter substrate-binding protein PstS [Methylophaga pinxianii]
MNKQIKSLFYFAVTLFSLSLTACDSKNPSMETSETEDFRPEIILAGSTFASPFFNKVLEIYGESHPTTKFTYRSIGSGAGIEQFIEGTADIGTTDAPINDKESARLNGEFEEIIVISGMISIAYNIDGLTDTLHLPRDVYTDIFLGNITRWNDPRILAANPNINLPSSAIQVIARSDSSGTTFAFTNHLATISPTWKTEFGATKLLDWPGTTVVAKGNEGVSQRLAITKNSISYVEFGFAKRLGLNVARLENKAGKFVLPDNKTGDMGLTDTFYPEAEDLASSIADPEGESAYPIVAYTWALIRQQYKTPDKASEIKNLINWTLEEGQSLAQPLYYLPLSPEIIQAEQEKLGL